KTQPLWWTNESQDALSRALLCGSDTSILAIRSLGHRSAWHLAVVILPGAFLDSDRCILRNGCICFGDCAVGVHESRECTRRHTQTLASIDCAPAGRGLPGAANVSVHAGISIGAQQGLRLLGIDRDPSPASRDPDFRKMPVVLCRFTFF